MVDAGNLEISLNERADIALWIDQDGKWQGVVQSESGAVPEPLLKITKQWTGLRVPVSAETNKTKTY